jgi:hypothetical protein
MEATARYDQATLWPIDRNENPKIRRHSEMMAVYVREPLVHLVYVGVTGDVDVICLARAGTDCAVDLASVGLDDYRVKLPVVPADQARRDVATLKFPQHPARSESMQAHALARALDAVAQSAGTLRLEVLGAEVPSIRYGLAAELAEANGAVCCSVALATLWEMPVSPGCHACSDAGAHAFGTGRSYGQFCCGSGCGLSYLAIESRQHR